MKLTYCKISVLIPVGENPANDILKIAPFHLLRVLDCKDFKKMMLYV
jgi:hypothetical protein